MSAVNLFAAAASPVLLTLSSAGVAAAVLLLGWTIRRSLQTSDLQQEDEWRYDVNRINELRRISPLYRVFQPVIQGLATMNRALFPDALPEIGRQVQAAGLPRFWTAAEYLGRLQLIGLFCFPLLAYVCTDMMGPSGLIMAVVADLLLIYWLRRRLAFQAAYRLLQIKRRLPFLLDLLTLLMEAGATFIQALTDAVREFSDHPAGVEFGRVLAEMSMGKSRTAALESLRDRLKDDEITSIVGSIIQGEQLGTPLARLFRIQADVLRIKRTQRAETLAGEAGVKMLGPAVVVMAATVLIILGPFVLRFVYSDFF